MRFSRNIVVMYTISLLQGMVFYAPVATLYRQAAGLGIFQITVIETVLLVLSMALELPWGYLADRIGYKKTMVGCCGLYFVSKLLFWRATGFGGFLLERIILAVVISGLSGVDTSILYLSCPEEDSQRVFGIYSTFGTVGLMLAALVCSLVTGENYRLAGLLTAVSYGLAALCALALEEVRPPRTEGTQSLRQETEHFLGILRACLRNRGLMLFVAAMGLFCETIHMVLSFFNQLQYQRAGLSVSAIGALYVAVTVCGLSASLSHRVTRVLGQKRTGAVLMGACALLCAGLAFTTGAAASAVAFVLMTIAESLMGPLVSALENKQITCPDRATALSVNALLQGGLCAVVDVFLGRMAEVGLTVLFLSCGVLCVVAMGLYGYALRNITNE